MTRQQCLYVLCIFVMQCLSWFKDLIAKGPEQRSQASKCSQRNVFCSAAERRTCWDWHIKEQQPQDILLGNGWQAAQHSLTSPMRCIKLTCCLLWQSLQPANKVHTQQTRTCRSADCCQPSLTHTQVNFPAHAYASLE